MTHAPIALFVYRRLEHTRQAVHALQQNPLAPDTELFVFSDGPKQPSHEPEIRAVREFVRQIKGFRSVHVIESAMNLGVAKSVIDGVTEVLGCTDRVIVIEDDIVTSPSFLTFMNQCLECYRDNIHIGSVTGYSLPLSIPATYRWSVYLTHRHSSWGWGTYRRVWSGVDWAVSDYPRFREDRAARRAFNIAGPDMTPMLDSQMRGSLDSWSIRFDYHCFKHQLLSLAPVNTLLTNIGFDGTGVHCDSSSKRLDSPLLPGEGAFRFPCQPELDPIIVAATRRFFPYSIASRGKRYLARLFAGGAKAAGTSRVTECP